ncbi:sugar phosphate isomerase/epimerase family protein [Actinoallomurus iriomotensis]|uniref:Xylose isomerase-like TIM barrel domain-containing protein n=1 Tax=Actinoallomurus iriomotensis TaxID=478107 RepID=A0A9W6RZ90_9ACTN|nr:sugar phosphate isomerase/epimerase [Actinoallomurus iriomotensis]GLY84239.1 hypothetical protein Airi02_021680 [Actinoallomurus iriomotensis]
MNHLSLNQWTTRRWSVAEAVDGCVRHGLEAIGLAPPDVGVVVDCFHVWWDPDVFASIARVGSRIASFPVCDLLDPLPADVVLGRAMMGDGVIDFRPLRAAVEAAGYTGDIEVEIFNADVWAADPDEVVATMKKRYAERVLG